MRVHEYDKRCLKQFVLQSLPGEPAGIGPELTLKLAQHHLDYEIVAIADMTDAATASTEA